MTNLGIKLVMHSYARKKSHICTKVQCFWNINFECPSKRSHSKPIQDITKSLCVNLHVGKKICTQGF